MVANENRRRFGERSFTEKQMLEMVALASYKDLVQLQRFEPVGSLWFTTKPVADAIFKRLSALRKRITDVERAEISKEIGW